MSVDVKDYRKNRLEAAANASGAAIEQAGLQQIEADAKYLTGDDKLDKLVRALAAQLKVAEDFSIQLSQATMRLVKDEDLKQNQLAWAYNQGKIDTLKATSQYPQIIMTELKMS